MFPAALCFVLVGSFTQIFANDIFSERTYILNREMDMMLGHDIVLSGNEVTANDIVMKLKYEELDKGFHNPELFNVSKHFFEYKDDVKKTKLYDIIRRMPKGAILHAHDTGILSPDYLVNVTYIPNLYICFTENNPMFRFSSGEPSIPCESSWNLLEDLRSVCDNASEFDTELRKLFTLVIDNPRSVYTDINAVWSKFADYFISTSGLFSYKPVWERYFYDSLKAFREDNVMYVEIRSVLPELYDLHGKTYDSVATAVSYKRVLQKFMDDYPDFMGAKLIYAPIRSVDVKTVEGYLNVALKIKKKMPDFLAGFDLVGQEDLGKPTKAFLAVLNRYKNKFNYFFHAGETNWYGTCSDENLVDAILLGARRIGHGYALLKHPVILREVKKRKIAIEVNVVSNAVLKLVEDVRNHPLAVFLAQDLPVVISSDDPGVWEADPASHDYYVTFVGVSSRRADLRLLKKLVLNSLQYSLHGDKDQLLAEFENRWSRFVDDVVRDKIAFSRSTNKDL